jgi:hypothetical protein
MGNAHVLPRKRSPTKERRRQRREVTPPSAPPTTAATAGLPDAQTPASHPHTPPPPHPPPTTAAPATPATPRDPPRPQYGAPRYGAPPGTQHEHGPRAAAGFYPRPILSST